MSGIWKSPKFGLLLAILMGAGMLFYMRHVLIPYQMADALLHQRPRGILSDLYPRWIGARELLLNHRNPYGPEVTREIQTGYYGRPIDPQRLNDPKDEQRFVYPVYVVFLLAPTVSVPFAEVRVSFTWILGIATASSVFWWLRAMRWRPPCSVSAIFVILTVCSFGGLQGIKLQQLSLLVAALIAGSAALLVSGQLFFAGVLLALASIKPQLIVLPAFWLLLWSVSSWRERRGFAWGFLLTSALLIGGGICLLPGWIGQFLAGLAAYNRYTGGRSLLDELTTPQMGPILTVLILLSAVVVCWRQRRMPAGSAEFNFCLALVLVVTVVAAPMIAPYNHLLLLPAVVLIVRSWNVFWRRGRMNQIFLSGAALIFFWSWLAALAITVASAFVPAASIQRAWAVPLWSSLGVPLVVLALLALSIVDLEKQKLASNNL